MSDAVLPLPVLLTTIIAVVVSFMLILENQNTKQQHEQETIHADDSGHYSWYEKKPQRSRW